MHTGYHPQWCLFKTPKLPTNPSAQDHLDRLRHIKAELLYHLHQAQLAQKDRTFPLVVPILVPLI